MFIFALMILLHIIDDFVMQPVCLSKLKQKSWWENNVRPNVSDEEWHMYKEDYRMALIVHSVSWSIMVTLPFLLIAAREFLSNGYVFDHIPRDSATIVLIILNAIGHFMVDNAKANKKTMGLWEDQIIHFFQILTVFIVLSVMYFPAAGL